jgi:hypothetical protein
MLIEEENHVEKFVRVELLHYLMYHVRPSPCQAFSARTVPRSKGEENVVSRDLSRTTSNERLRKGRHSDAPVTETEAHEWAWVADVYPALKHWATRFGAPMTVNGLLMCVECRVPRHPAVAG